MLVGFGLDRLWAETMGIEADETKERPLRLVAEVLNGGQVAYALIGGVAVQIHVAEPRTTLDIADVVALLEEHPALRTPAVLTRLRDLQQSLLPPV